MPVVSESPDSVCLIFQHVCRVVVLRTGRHVPTDNTVNGGCKFTNNFENIVA